MNDDYLKTYANLGLYTMQGRLSVPEDGRFQSFPRKHWQTEIELAAQVPLQGIEWIYDLYGEGANPLETTEGRLDLRTRLQQANLQVRSICADYFMDCPFLRTDDETLDLRLSKLSWLISICPAMNITRIVLPFVDNSRISNGKEAERVLAALHSLLPAAATARVELHLETDMNPKVFRSFLNEIIHPMLKVNYDSGNSAALGYRPFEEFTAYGERIGSFHIKDRLFGGGTVPLGSGHVDFSSLRECLLEINYNGDFVLQVARDVVGKELNCLRKASSSACSWLRGDGILI